MGVIFQQTSGGAQSVNQATGGTSVTWKRLRHLIFTPLDYRLTPSDMATLKTKIQEDAVDDDPDSRIYIIKNILEAEPANTNAVTLEFGYGYSEQVYNGQYGMNISFSSSNLIEQVLRQRFNGREGDFLCIPVEDDLQFITTQDADSTNGASVSGLDMFQWRAADLEFDPGAGVKQKAYIQFADRSQINGGNLVILKTNINMNAIRQVADVNIQLVAGPTTRVISLAFPVAGEYQGVNLADKYGAILAANPSLALFTNHATGASIAITTAAAASINGIAVITYTLSATNYPSSGGSVDVTLDDVSALSAVLIKYFETPEVLNIPIP